MGRAKKEAARKERQGVTGDGMGNVRVKGENFYRTAKKVKVARMFNEGKAQRNAAGKITKSASYQSRDAPKARVEPHRKWFGNTRVIAQDALASFREALEEKAQDPYQVLLKSNKLPMSLIRHNETTNGVKQHQAKIAVGTAPFSDTFGPKAQRKKVKLDVGSLEDMAGQVEMNRESFAVKTDEQKPGDGLVDEMTNDAETLPAHIAVATAREPIFSKGQSKRIWNELYKVIDSSDVVIHVLDARDPLGTRCRSVEKYIKEEAPHKHLIFALNKCDLVPTRVAVSVLPSSLSAFCFDLLLRVPYPSIQVKAPSHSYVLYAFNEWLSVTTLEDQAVGADSVVSSELLSRSFGPVLGPDHAPPFLSC